MKTIKFVCIALVLLPALLQAEKKEKKPKVAEAINLAHVVFVQAADGEETKPGLAREDMQAIANMRIALRNWGRYQLTDNKAKADLIVVVRTARRRSDAGGVLGRGTQGSGSSMGGSGGDMPAPQGGQQFPGQGRESSGGINDDSVFDVDRLEICQLKPNGKLTGAIWSRSMDGGLTPPRLLLFAQFKDDVEKAFPAPAPEATPQPANQ
jgi:hypothetical protein